MKTLSSISLLVALTSLAACSASSGPAGKADGNGGGSGTSNNGGGGTGGDTVVVGGTGGTAGTSIIPPGGMGGTAGNECGLQTFNLARRPAEVLLVLDRSFSMDEPPEEYLRPDGTPETAKKWDIIIPALLDVLGQTDAALSWGMKVFPEGEFAGACEAGTVTPNIDVEIAENNAQAVIDQINMTNDHGDGTPTGDAIKQAVAYLQSRESLNDYNRYILLATDGEPSCINVTETSGPGSDSQETARPYAVEAITTAAALPSEIKTFVVGVGTNKQSAKDALNAMAIAGEVPAPCANPLAECFYLGNSRDQLVSDLRAIATNISTCVFDLTATPPQPDNIRVTLDGEKIDRDMTKTDGWDYQDPEQTIVEVYGPSCQRVKGSTSATVEIIFGCPDIDVR